ncbi:hypothetical protein A2U01_0010015, partial [Trifolium medium]|nr:hypothetical protein [Trifolium medium]
MSCGKQGVQASPDLSESQSQPIPFVEHHDPIAVSSRSIKTRKSESRLPFPGLVGPKCMRLVETIKGSSRQSRRRTTQKHSGGGVVRSLDGGGIQNPSGGGQV